MRRYLARPRRAPRSSPWSSQISDLNPWREQQNIGNQISSMTVSLGHRQSPTPPSGSKTIYCELPRRQGDGQSAYRTPDHGSDGDHAAGLAGARRQAPTRPATSADHVAPINVVISNVPGPDFAIYLAGAVGRAARCPSDRWSWRSVIEHHLFELQRGSVDFGFVTTPEIANDIADLADAVEPALRELEAAAGLTTN